MTVRAEECHIQRKPYNRFSPTKKFVERGREMLPQHSIGEADTNTKFIKYLAKNVMTYIENFPRPSNKKLLVMIYDDWAKRKNLIEKNVKS
jgi:hypothetical protein